MRRQLRGGRGCGGGPMSLILTTPKVRAVLDHSVGKELPVVAVESFECLPGRGVAATLSGVKDRRKRSRCWNSKKQRKGTRRRISKPQLPKAWSRTLKSFRSVLTTALLPFCEVR
ncbi:uncharacterized protein [Miscanthus floridulus]|uniref:uncharacterized protein isoform X2 n=1 Tax=Miscanthus floridulus TaxID=154761 RepID=UPI003457CDD4